MSVCRALLQVGLLVAVISATLYANQKYINIECYLFIINYRVAQKIVSPYWLLVISCQNVPVKLVFVGFECHT